MRLTSRRAKTLSLQQKSQLSKTLLATWCSRFINQLTRVLVLKMSLSRPSNAYDALAPSESFFEREKARLIEEISTVWSLLVGISTQRLMLTRYEEFRRAHGQHECTKSNIRTSLWSGKRIYNGCVFMGCKSVEKSLEIHLCPGSVLTR